jgi:serine/threonine protein kinase
VKEEKRAHSTSYLNPSLLHSLFCHVFFHLLNSEIQINRLVGQGGFSSVFSVQSIEPASTSTSNTSTRSRRRFDNEFQQGQQKLVLKRLRLDLGDEEHAKGILDLALECEFLAALEHPNIIRMVGYANKDSYDDDFFVLLEFLSVTLDRKFNSWRRTVEACAGFWIPMWGYCCARSPEMLTKCWLQRWQAAQSIAQALFYLHENRIVYRDLKPDNIGYTSRGILKLFDFGLAKRLDPADLVGQEKEFYRLTGNTGSLRYMAPEVSCNDPYDERVDVYSFGILLWQIAALTTPFYGMTAKNHATQVVELGYRPSLQVDWQPEWCELMEQCWRADSRLRPTMVSTSSSAVETPD